MSRPVLGRMLDRERQGVGIVQVPVLIRNDEREVRRDEPHEEAPRLPLGGRLLPEPADGPVGDGAVVADVLALPRPRLKTWVRLWGARHVAAEEPVEVAHPLEYVHGDPLVREARGVVHLPVVQLPDRRHPVPLGGEAVPPAPRLGSHVRGRVVPRVDGVRPAAGRQAAPRRHADRALTVRAGEARPAGGQGVERGRLGRPVAVAAEHAAAVLVREDEEHVGRSHRVGVLLQ